MVIVVATAIAAMAMAMAMARQQSVRQRSARRRLPHTIVGSIATATENVTTTTTDLYGSDVVAHSKGNVRPVWAVRLFTPGSAAKA